MLKKAIILLCLVGAAAAPHILMNKQSAPAKDGYVRYAYSLATWGMYGLATSTEEQPEPSIGRAPLYPLFLAAIMKMSPTYTALVENFVNGEENYSLDAGLVPYVQMAVMSLVGLAVFVLARLYGSNLFFAYAFSWLSMLHLFVYAYQYRLSESLGVPLFALASLFLGLWFKGRPHMVYIVGVGLALGLLMLTRVVHIYFVPFVVLAVLFLPTMEGWLTRRRRIAAAGVFLVVTCIVVLPWVGRNVAVMDTYQIGPRGTDRVLAVRASYNSMNAKEMLGGSIYFLPALGPTIAQAMLPENWWTRFNTENPKGFRKLGFKLFEDYKYRYPDSPSLKKEFYKAILENPIGHLKAMVPLTVRGLRHALPYLPLALLALWWMRSRPDIVLILGSSLLTILTYVLHIGVTHFNSRYGMPMVVGVAPLAGVGMTYVYSAVQLRLSSRPHAETS